MEVYVRLRDSISIVIVVVGIVVAPTLLAQTDRGSIVGKISDTTGAIVGGATVTVKNEETGVVSSGRSNDAGDFLFSDLNPGKYTVIVEMPGFHKVETDHVQVDVGSRVKNDAHLSVGSSEQSVTVQADVQQLNYTSAGLGMVIEQKAITDLPLIYGNPFALEFLTPGLTVSGVNPNIHVYDSSSATVSVNGSALNALDYKLDGAPDNRIRFSAFTPSTEFIAQYKIDTATYDASQGHSSGGFVNTQLKSGTNRVHGSVFAYYQNPKINSNVWALTPTNSKPTFVREGAGGGGTFYKDKAFWFAGFEHSRQGTPNVQTLTVPTAAERNGDFSALYALGSGTVCGTTPRTIATGANPYQIFDPFSATPTSATATTYNRTCLPGNIIPASRISAVAKADLALYPLSNVTGKADGENNYAYSASEPDNYNAEVLRLDYTISQRQNLYSHLIRSSRVQANKNNFFPPVSGTTLDYENRGIVLGHVFVLNPNTVITSTAAYTRFTTQSNAGATGVITPTSQGFPGYTTAGQSMFANSAPRIDLTTYTSATTATGIQSFDDIYLGNVSASQTKGSLFMRYGFEYRRYLTNGLSGSGSQGQYVSNGSLASASSSVTPSTGIGLAVAQLELGAISSGTQTQNADFAIRSDYYAGFFQNDWRATQKLTLNIGLRWEYETPDVERNGKQAVAFSFGATNSTTLAGAATYASKVAGSSALLPASISPTGGFVFANQNDAGKDPYTSPKYSFLPRIGFAYAANQKTVIRGGFGLFFDSLNSYLLSGGNSGSTTLFVIPQQGYSATSTVAAPTFTNAGNGTGTLAYTSTLANPFPGGLTPVSGNSLGASTALGQNIQFLQPNPHTPYNERYSIGAQRQLGQWIASIDYVGNHGVHLPVGQISQGVNTGGREFNNVPAQYYSKVTNAYDYTENTTINNTNSTTNPFFGLIPSGAAANLSSSKTSIAQLLRPLPEYASINAFTTDGMSIYHSLQAQLQRRFTNGLSFTAAYTWSRTLDATTFLNPTDPRPWYGISANDRPQRLAVSGIYQLPFGRGRRYLGDSRNVIAQVVGGWQVQGVYQIQSGAPLTFTTNPIYLGTNPADAHFTRAQYKASLPSNGGSGSWFDTSKFVSVLGTTSANTIFTCGSTVPICPTQLPGTYQIRTIGLRYSTLRADNLNQADVGVQREFRIREYATFQFRGEAVNMLNHPVYAVPLVNPTASTFGQIISQANQPRVFQFAGFLRF
jgi:hypothetical protein